MHRGWPWAGTRPPALSSLQLLAPAPDHASPSVPSRTCRTLFRLATTQPWAGAGKGEEGPTTPAPSASYSRECSLSTVKLFTSDFPAVKITDSKICICQRTGIETIERNSPNSTRNRQNTQYFLKEERFEQVFYKGNGSL